jgi:hypothetical protein
MRNFWQVEDKNLEIKRMKFDWHRQKVGQMIKCDTRKKR